MDDERTEETTESEPAEAAPTPKRAPVTKVSPVVTQAEAEAAASTTAAEPPDVHDVQVSLGPFFSLGALLVVVGVLRRRPLALAAGLGAIWVDQRSAFGQRLKERIRARARR